MAKLGTTQIGTGYLSTITDIAFTEPITASSTTDQLTNETVTEVSTEDFGVTASMGGQDGLAVTVLNPTNLQTTYDEEREAFVSEWFQETSVVPEESIETVVITADLRSDEPITVFAERDDTGDGTVDDRSQTYEAGYGYVEPLENIEAVEGSQYRVVFPEYARDDDVTAVRLALTWNNEEEVRDEWSLHGIDYDSGFIGDVLSTYASSLHILDTRIDEEYDNRFLDSASGPILDVHGAPVGINRQSGEQDDDLRYRIGVEYTINFSDGTLSSVESVLRQMFDSTESISWDLVDNEPTVTIPQSMIDETPFTQDTIEQKLERAMPSSYGLTVQNP